MESLHIAETEDDNISEDLNSYIEETENVEEEMQDLFGDLNENVEEDDTTMDLERMLEEALSGENKKEDESVAMNEQDVTQNRNAIEETAIITQFMVITGNIESEGSVELLGTIKGNVDILGKLNVSGCIQGDSSAAEIFSDSGKIEGKVVSDGAVKIGTGSVVIGDIVATSAVIAGAVKGDIDVQGPVILDSTAIVMGNIKSKSVQINNGAVIEGMCSQSYAEVSPTSFFDDYKPESKKAKNNKKVGV